MSILGKKTTNVWVTGAALPGAYGGWALITRTHETLSGNRFPCTHSQAVRI